MFHVSYLRLYFNVDLILIFIIKPIMMLSTKRFAEPNRNMRKEDMIGSVKRAFESRGKPAW
jgi:hypothetical protein